MLSTVSQINNSNIIQYQKHKLIHFKNVPQSQILSKKDSGTTGKDDFVKQQITPEQKKRLLMQFVIFPAVLGSIIGAGVYIFKNKNFNFLKKTDTTFKSLKDDASIPTLDTCNSINKDLKNALQKQVNLLKADKELLEEVGGGEQINTFLIAGPTGTGKTFFSKIYAKTLGADYLEVLFSHINSRWAGATIEMMDNIFKKIITQAKKNPQKRYVVTFNEIDTLLSPVEHLTGGSGATHFATLRRERSTFLTYLDRLTTEAPNVFIIGTTNMQPKTKNLDAAAMSRFSKIIEITYPDKDCLYEAMKNNLSKIKNINDFMVNSNDKIKKLTETMSNRKFSYRDLESLLDDARMFYLEEKLVDKNAKFKFKYIEDAYEHLKYSDGEREIQNLKHF